MQVAEVHYADIGCVPMTLEGTCCLRRCDGCCWVAAPKICWPRDPCDDKDDYGKMFCYILNILIL